MLTSCLRCVACTFLPCRPLVHSILQQEDFAVLQPLVLALKSILKQNSLGDVATGGLGSWSLANMVIAHLQVQ